MRLRLSAGRHLIDIDAVGLMHFRLQTFDVAKELLRELLRPLLLPIPHGNKGGWIEFPIDTAGSLDGLTAKAALKLDGEPRAHKISRVVSEQIRSHVST